MLQKMRDLKGFAIGAKDGNIGEVKDFVFDDKTWVNQTIGGAEREAGERAFHE